MIRLAWAALAALALAQEAGAQVGVRAELGWQGRAVAGEVNPLLVAVQNDSASPLSGTVRVEQRVGSSWRGQALHRAQAPVFLPPRGRGTVVIPWPVEAVAEPLVVAVESGGTELARAVLPVRPGVEKIVAVVGAVVADAPGPVLFFAPEDVPEDPLLFAPFTQVRLAPGVSLPPQARGALAAWVAFGGGSAVGFPAPGAIPPLAEADLRAALLRHGPRSPPTLVLMAAVTLYLILLGYVLPPLAQRGRARPAAAAVALGTAFALFYPVVYDEPQILTAVQYSIYSSDVIRYGLDTLAVTHHRGGEVVVPGHWVERARPGVGRAYTELRWERGEEGVRTRVRLERGKTIFLSRYSGPWDGEGRAAAEAAGAGEGFGPVLAVLKAVAREGDRIVLDRREVRRGGEVWVVYRARWERGG